MNLRSAQRCGFAGCSAAIGHLPHHAAFLNSKQPGWVYFIRATRGGAGTCMIKIGWAKNPRARVAELQTGSPLKLDLLGAVPGSRKDEAALHAKHALSHSHGEWFHLDWDTLDELKRPDAAYLHQIIVEWLWREGVIET